MDKVLRLENPPIAFEAVWGNGFLARRYGYAVAPGVDVNRTALGGGFGEDYVIADGAYAGQTIGWLYESHPDFFGTAEQRRWETLPVSMGVCYAAEDLSVQVHPREDWALEHLGIHGKSECWYFVDCPPGQTVVRGHRAQTLDEVRDYIARGDWEGLMLRDPVRPGGFYAIKAGTLHAIQKGSWFIEICNPCPVTYRLFDYERLDADGRPRQLDVERALENLLVPYEPIRFTERVGSFGGVTERVMADNEDYAAWLWTVAGAGVVPLRKPFAGCYVVRGSGTAGGLPVSEGESFFVPATTRELDLAGEMTVLCCHG